MMRPKLLIAAAPIVLLAACGDSGPSEDAAPATATTQAPETSATTSPVAASPTAPAASEETPGPADKAQPTPTPPAAAPAASPTAPAKASAAAPASPPSSFAQCRTCHSVEPGKNGVGPTLFGIVGSKAGEVKGYNFSPALAKSGIVWNRASLDTWLKGPMKMVPGTKMVIAQPDAAKRKEIIDYLETLK